MRQLLQKAAGIAILALALLPGLAAAQNGPPSSEGTPFTVATCMDQFRKATPQPGSRTFIDETQPIVQHKATTGASDLPPLVTTSASLVAGDADGRGVINFSGKGGAFGASTLDWGLKVSVPFDKDKKEGIFASRSGVGGDVVFSASFSAYNWSVDVDRAGRNLCDRCAADPKVKFLQDCFQENLSVSGTKPNTFSDDLFGKVAAWQWGLEGSIGRKDRKFFDSAAVEDSEHREALSFSLVASIEFSKPISVYGRLSAKTTFKEGDKVRLCKPVTGAPALESCKELPFEQAKEQESLVAAVEVRQLFTRVALAPSAEYDIDESEWTLQLPIYVVRNSDDKFTGGVRLGWTSEDRKGEDNWGVAIFVTKPFDL